MDRGSILMLGFREQLETNLTKHCCLLCYSIAIWYITDVITGLRLE